MSRNSNNVTKKPYCKVCHDVGKPESEYTSHWVKDFTGKTTCPTLLNTECRYCYKLGHTTKFCDVLAKNTKKKDKAERSAQAVTTRKQAAPEVQKKTQNAGVLGANMFEALCDDNESEEKVSNTIYDNEYPSLCESKKKAETKVNSDWSDALDAAMAEVVEPELIQLTNDQRKLFAGALERGVIQITDQKKKTFLQALETKVEQPKPAPAPSVSFKSNPIQKKNWADWSDSDSEDDELPPSNQVLTRSQTTCCWDSSDIDVDDEW